jgi:predicted secreted acid phosphatase
MHYFRYLVLAIISVNCFAEPQNLSLLKEEIYTYHDSGEYDKELSKVILNATEFIIKRANANHNEKLAIVLDIDETSVSNYENIKDTEFSQNPKVIEKWLYKAESTTIKPVLELYNTAKSHRIAVFFVTGRKESLKNVTITSLNANGYKNWDGLYFRSDDSHYKSISTFKSAIRKNITMQGYIIIASIGDQMSDLTGGYAEKVFKLPNPFYFIP